MRRGAAWWEDVHVPLLSDILSFFPSPLLSPSIINLSSRAHTHTHTHTCTHVNTHVPIRTCVHTHVHTHKHTRMQPMLLSIFWKMTAGQESHRTMQFFLSSCGRHITLAAEAFALSPGLLHLLRGKKNDQQGVRLSGTQPALPREAEV